MNNQQNSIENLINQTINEKYNLKNGYNDIYFNDTLYKQFILDLGFEYYESLDDLFEQYEDYFENISKEKQELCQEHHIISLEDKKTKEYVIALRDIVSTDIEELKQFYFSKIVVISDDVVEGYFGDTHNELFATNFELNEKNIEHFYHQMMSQAIIKGASDIHIQKVNNKVNIWYRIDGIKLDLGTMPVSLAKTLKRKLVTMADQEDSDFNSINGIITYPHGHQNVKFRLGLINSKFNFSIVLRIIGGKVSISEDLTRLNYQQKSIEALEKLIKNDNGMILVTGQVGSGKTQLMYALLKKLALGKQYIVTIENPVEFVDENLFQIDLSEYESANQENKYSYPEAVVDILRQDSNIILIGETREPETAYQLVNASNLGQLVFSTMHTNSAHATVSRMTSSLGIDKGDIVDELRGIVSQKLVRRLCKHCKVKDGNGGYKPQGCNECKGSGYKNRVPVAEIVRFKLGCGGDFDGPAEYISLKDACEMQYFAGNISKSDMDAIVEGREVWYD